MWGRWCVGLVVLAVTASCGGGDQARDARRTVLPMTTSPASSAPAVLPPTTGAPTPAILPIGSLAVGTRGEELVDPSRPTPANGNAPGSAERSMPTTVWYPAVGVPSTATTPDAAPETSHAPFPLVVFAHGYAVTPEAYASLLSRIASAGYVVVAPSLPLLRGDAPGGPSHADYGAPNIADLGFALDEAVRRAETEGDPLHGVADPTRVGVAGHSDGEVLAYALAYEPCCHDPRVGAAVLLAGNLANARVLPVRTGVRALHVLAERDEYSPYADSIAFDRAHLPAPSWSLTLRGAEHAPPFRDPTDPHFDLVARATVDLLDQALKGAVDGPRRLEVDVAAVGDLASLEARTS